MKCFMYNKLKHADQNVQTAVVLKWNDNEMIKRYENGGLECSTQPV